jgi:predicted enzyme related to lactoylglutathione lyase
MLRAGALAAGLLVAACQPAPAAKPAEEQAVTQPAPVNPVVHFEIPVTDMDRAVRFYEAVFAVKLERRAVDGYDMAFIPRADGRPGASGALAKGDVYKPTRDGAILYFDVPDIDAVITRAETAGGSVLYPKKDIGEAGFVAEIADSEGNRIALSQAAE